MPALSDISPGGLISRPFLALQSAGAGDWSSIAEDLSTQWGNPSDVMSVLLLVGPDIVQKAVAQLTGRSVTPVAFSFGWVAFAASSILCIASGGQLMPKCDTAEPEVLAPKSGHQRSTTTWVLGRLLRDLEYAADQDMVHERPHEVSRGLGRVSKNPELSTGPSRTARSHAQVTGIDVPAGSGSGTVPGKASKPWEALRVEVFEVSPNEGKLQGVPSRDWVWLSGFAVIGIQLVISIIPWIIEGDWGIFMVTALGNALSLTESSLPQWKEEKWPKPQGQVSARPTVILTRGNGSRYAALIKCQNDAGLDFDIMARNSRTVRPSLATKVTVALLAICWLMLLICASALQQNTWYLLGIGLLGSIQNLIAAGVVRKPGAHGLHMHRSKSIADGSVAGTLQQLEGEVEFAGLSLVDVFFPGGLRVKGERKDFWKSVLEKRKRENEHGTLLDQLLSS